MVAFTQKTPGLNFTALSIDNLKILIEVALAGSETEAAKRMNTSVSALSRPIGELEKATGRKLRDYGSGSATISADGQELIRIAQLYFAGLGEFIHKGKNQLTSVHVGAGDSLIHLAIAPQLSEIHKDAKFKETVIHISDVGRFRLDQSLRNYSIDIGIFREELLKKPALKERKSPTPQKESFKRKKPPSIQSIELGKYGYSLFIPKGLVPDPSKIPFADISFAAKRIYWETDLIEMARQDHIDVNVRVWCSNLAQVIRLVQEGNYAAILPTFSRTLLPENRFLKHSTDLLKSHTDNVVLAYNTELLRVKEETLRPFIEKLAKQLKPVFIE